MVRVLQSVELVSFAEVGSFGLNLRDKMQKKANCKMQLA